MMDLLENDYSEVSHVVFDAYGTLLTPSKLNLISILKQAKNYSKEQLISLLEKSDPQQFLSKELQEKINLDIQKISPYPEVVSVLEKLKWKGYHLSIDSNLIKPYAEPIKRHFITYIDEFIFSFEKDYRKGQSEHYQELISYLKIPPKSILFIGDSYVNDYLGPKQSWINALHLQRDKFPKWESLSTLTELLDLLK